MAVDEVRGAFDQAAPGRGTISIPALGRLWGSGAGGGSRFPVRFPGRFPGRFQSPHGPARAAWPGPHARSRGGAGAALRPNTAARSAPQLRTSVPRPGECACGSLDGAGCVGGVPRAGPAREAPVAAAGLGPPAPGRGASVPGPEERLRLAEPGGAVTGPVRVLLSLQGAENFSASSRSELLSARRIRPCVWVVSSFARFPAQPLSLRAVPLCHRPLCSFPRRDRAPPPLPWPPSRSGAIS